MASTGNEFLVDRECQPMVINFHWKLIVGAMTNRKQDTPYGLRMPNGMRDEVKGMAAANGRSMNAEIVFHLRKALGAAAGGSFGDQAPAAGSETAAL